MFEGLALSMDGQNARIIFTATVPFLDTFVKLFQYYCKSPDVNYYILKVYRQLMNILVCFDFLSQLNF